jgi:membrane-associated phospholipid phosphatase
VIKPTGEENLHKPRIVEGAPRMVRSSTTSGLVVNVMLVAALIFSLLARFCETFPGDVSLIRWMQNWQHPTTTVFMEAVSQIGRPIVLLGLAGAAMLGLFLAKRRREGFVAVGLLNGLGFPSGHAYQSFVLFGFFVFLAAIFVKRIWLRRSFQVFLTFLVLAIGVSRIYLGAHWPSDILGAYLLGGSLLGLLLRSYQAPLADAS